MYKSKLRLLSCYFQKLDFVDVYCETLLISSLPTKHSQQKFTDTCQMLKKPLTSGPDKTQSLGLPDLMLEN